MPSKGSDPFYHGLPAMLDRTWADGSDIIAPRSPECDDVGADDFEDQRKSTDGHSRHSLTRIDMTWQPMG